jgi:hypothetical protein
MNEVVMVDIVYIWLTVKCIKEGGAHLMKYEKRDKIQVGLVEIKSSEIESAYKRYGL